MVQLAQEYNLPLVGTNDCHYLLKSDHKLHDVMLCIQMKKTIDDQDRIQFDNHFYFKTVSEMRQSLEMFPEEAITNTVEIANRCNLELDLSDSLMPQYEVPEGYTNDTFLKKVCYDGLQEKYGSHLSNEIQERINHELDVIEKTGYAGYFLIVWDYVKYATEKGHFLSARGSAGSSLVLYAMNVISFNPMDYNCIFERFLNTERISPPDIDVDFTDRARDDVIAYLKKKYGEDCVGKVATFSTFNKKSAIADVARALKIPISEVRKIQKSKKELSESTENTELVELTTSIEGIKRHVSSHPSAFIVSNKPLMNYVPLFKDAHDYIVSQYEGSDVEKLGIVKFDLLSVTSLTETQDCINLVKKNHGVELILEEIPLDDPKTYSLINRGLNSGLFQIHSSPGMRHTTSRVRPENFTDFLAISALYRPGPLQSGMTEKFINRKNGEEEISYPHPLLENALKETYGCCIYQEQIMSIARDMAGFTLGEADVLRSAMGKVNKDLLLSQREKFIEGAGLNGVNPSEAGKVFDIIEPFGSYGFNKSHTVCYSLLSYWMAYLKTHYPHEFISCLMSGAQGDPAKLLEYRQETKALAKFLEVTINISAPDINKSYLEFTVKGNNIYFGLECLKGVGVGVIEEIVHVREKDGEFTSLKDFCSKVDSKKVKKKAVECLVEAGTFDLIEPNRAEAFSLIEDCLKSAKGIQEEKERGQMTLFDDFFDEPKKSVTKKTKVEDWTNEEKLEREKKILGFYVSGHPLEKYEDIVENYTTLSSSGVRDAKSGTNIYFMGTISKIRKITTRSKKKLIIFTLTDLEGAVEAILYSGLKQDMILEENVTIWIRGTIQEDSPPGVEDKTTNQIQIQEILTPDQVVKEKTSDVEIYVSRANYNEDNLKELRKITLLSTGKKNLLLSLPSKKGRVIAKCGPNHRIAIEDNIFDQIKKIFGPDSINLSNRSTRLQLS